MARDDLDLDALGLSDEDPGSGSSGSGTGGGGSGRRRGKGRRGLLAFLLGVALGAAVALFAPRFLGPYLPASIAGGGETVEGEVLGKRLEGERLLLTVETPRGAVLATFRDRVAEIDLLVEEGDSVALGLGRYRPFVDDPDVEGVRKAAARTGRATEGGTRDRSGPTPSGSEPAGGEESDPSGAEPDADARAEPEAGAAEEPADSGRAAGRPDRPGDPIPDRYLRS